MATLEVKTNVAAAQEIARGVMSIMGNQGDIKTVWSSANAEEVAAARRQFDELRAKGFAGYSVRANGERGTLLTDFDPDAESIIMVPPLAGG